MGRWSTLKELWQSPSRRYVAWQVELTTRCPLRCRMCIRQCLDNWEGLDMDFDCFRSLSPSFRNVEHVVLEGWGEPLIYPHLLDAVRLVKGQGARAGFVTSGYGLTRDYSAELLRAGLDFIGFSLAGATAPTHEAIRIHSNHRYNLPEGYKYEFGGRGLVAPDSAAPAAPVPDSPPPGSSPLKALKGDKL